MHVCLCVCVFIVGVCMHVSVLMDTPVLHAQACASVHTCILCMYIPF